MTDETVLSKTELLARIERGWDEFKTYIKTLTDSQLTTPTDAAGWTAKDHLTHIAVWEDGTFAIFQGLDRPEYMGVDKATWDSHDYDKINAVIQQRHKNKSLAETMTMLNETHRRVVDKLQSLSDEELQRPYNHYQPGSSADAPAINWVTGNTYEHYAEHIPWIDAIVKGS
jgi:hypothetical protein